jgi:hypothetical protein
LRGKETYLRQSVTAVLIGLAATLAAGWSHASGAQPATHPGEPLTEVRVQAVGSQAFDVSFAEEGTTTETSTRGCFAANAGYFLPGLPTGVELSKQIIAAKAQCIN